MRKIKNFKPSRSAPVKYSIKVTKKTIPNTMMKAVDKVVIKPFLKMTRAVLVIFIFSFSIPQYHILIFQ